MLRWLIFACACALSVGGAVGQVAETPVELMVMQEVSARTATSGQRFRLETVKPLTIGAISLPAGAAAWGEVIDAEPAAQGGRGGRIAARLVSLEWHGQSWPIEGSSGTQTARTSRSVTALSASIGPFALFAKGNDARLKAGEIVIGYVRTDAASPAVEMKTLAAGTSIWLQTETVLSSQTTARGTIVPLIVVQDVRVDGVVLIPKGARGFGQVVRADAKAAFGIGGRISLELRHIEVGNRIVRIDGERNWSARNGPARGLSSSAFTAAAAVAITGRRAEVPAGTRIGAVVLHDTALPAR